MMFSDFAAVPRNRYGVIYVDPPWRFRSWSVKGTGRSAEQHYRTLSFDELAAFPVADLAADRCALFLWVVRSHLPDSMRLLDAWGFAFKSTAFCLAKTCKRQPDKPRISFGKWTRTGVEQCWLATRGRQNPARRSASVRELVIAPIREHSRKPDEVYDRVERLVDGPYLELFARQPRPGWDSWGDQLGHFERPATATGQPVEGSLAVAW